MNGLMERAKDWKTTGSGAAIQAVLIAALQSLHCDIPSWLWLVTFLPTIHGILAKSK